MYGGRAVVSIIWTSVSSVDKGNGIGPNEVFQKTLSEARLLQILLYYKSHYRCFSDKRCILHL